MQLVQLAASIGAIALVLWAVVVPWHREQGNVGPDDGVLETVVAFSRTTTPVVIRPRSGNTGTVISPSRPFVARDYGSLPSQSANGVSDEHRDLIMSVSDSTGVPGGILYGIWTNESRRLPEGYSDRWPTASSLLGRGSACWRYLAEHGHDPGQCQVWYASLRRVCAQRRPDGSAVCDMDTVRVSQTFDMGPMQHNARSIVRRRSDRQEGEPECSSNDAGSVWCWGPHITDADGDGVFDPGSLSDAMMASARALRRAYDECEQLGSRPSIGCWGYAVNEYAGAQSSHYYQRRIHGLWAQWCSVPGYCG